MKQPWYVLGGGIVGLLSARELCAAGESVVILDRQTVGQESSWAGGGILSPLHPWRYPESVTTQAMWSQDYYPALASELAEKTGIDVEWTPSGMLYVESEEVTQAVSWAKAHGATLSDVDAATACQISPKIRPEVGHGIWMPDVAQIRNPRLLSAISADLHQSGVKFRENVEILGFIVQRNRLVAIRTNRGEIETHRCLVAAGAWSGDLMAPTGIALPITPVKGQMLLLSAQALHINTMILKDNRYIIPRRDGRVLVGSTLEPTGFEKSTTETARTELMQAAVNIIPALADCVIERHWAGLRPGTPSGVPYIGEHPKAEGLFVCSGHFRNGIVLAPASARLVVDIMLGRTPSFEKAQFQLPLA